MKLITLFNNVPKVNTRVVAAKIDIDQRTLHRIIQNFKEDFLEFGKVEIAFLKGKRGPATEIYWLNEEQLSLLLMYLSNTDEIRKFKIEINKIFHKMRKFIFKQQQEKSIQLYTKARTNSKFVRLMETDVIKEFVEYAKRQGSNNADKYYIHFSNLAKAYFDIQINLKGKNFRELLSAEHLYKIATADNIIKTAIKAGMKNSLPYKDVYKLAKKKVGQGVELIGGKELIPEFTKLIGDD